MCNNIHEEYKRIEETGYAWKLFGINKKSGKLLSLFGRYHYEKEKSGWILYKVRDYPGDGFCAFARKEEAIKAQQDLQDRWDLYSTTIILEIEYNKGLAIQEERCMVSGKVYEIIVIGAFKVIEEERKYV